MKFIVALSLIAVVAADVSHLLGATDYSSEYAAPIGPQLEYGPPAIQSVGISSGVAQVSQSYIPPPAPVNEYLPPVSQYAAPAQQYIAPQYNAPAVQYSAPVVAPHYSAPQYSSSFQQYSAPLQHYSAVAPQYSAPVQHYSQPESEYLPPPAPQYAAPIQHYSAPVEHYSAPAVLSDSGSSYESHDDGYHYKTVKRIRYRHRA